MAVLTGVRWNLSVVLICISFIARDAELFFMWFLWALAFNGLFQAVLPLASSAHEAKPSSRTVRQWLCHLTTWAVSSSSTFLPTPQSM
jgi:hypothetical protein